MNSVANQLAIELLYPLLSVFIVLGFLYLVINKFNYNNYGEKLVGNELEKLDQTKYKVINDLTIIVDGLTHQIDHIVVSKFGIFVIETKQYSGYIKGNEFDKQWIQNNRTYINNPILQNYGHVKSLQERLKLPENFFIPIVCVPSRARLKINSKRVVAKIYNLNEIINSYTEEIIPDYNIIYQKLCALKSYDRNIRDMHVNIVRHIVKEKYNNNNNNNTNVCPLCGSNLVERRGKYGNFIGCTNYPRCRYTKKL